MHFFCYADSANTANTANTTNTANTASTANTANTTNTTNTANTANTANTEYKSIILEGKTFKTIFTHFFLSSWLYWSFKRLLSIKENGGMHQVFKSTLREMSDVLIVQRKVSLK